MKKTVLITALMAAFTLTACEDKQLNQQLSDVQAKVSQLEQEKIQIQTTLTEKEAALVDKEAQLSNKDSEIVGLKQELEKVQQQLVDLQQKPAEAVVAAIQSEMKTILDKEETVKVEKLPTDDLTNADVTMQVNIVTTQLDWLNQLLFQKLVKDYAAPESEDKPSTAISATLTEQDIKTFFETQYAESKEDIAKNRVSNYDTSMWMKFIGQRYQLATFSITSEFYRGGAHGVFSTDYVNVDLARQKEITLTDLLDESAIKGGLREVLWARYGEYLNDKEIEPFIEEKDFRVSPNFRIEADEIVFVYPLYELAPYVFGLVELPVSKLEINKFLKPEYQLNEKDGHLYKLYKTVTSQ